VLNNNNKKDKPESDKTASEYIGLIVDILLEGNEEQEKEDDELRRVDSVTAACAALLRIAEYFPILFLSPPSLLPPTLPSFSTLLCIVLSLIYVYIRLRRYENIFTPQQFETFAWVARDPNPLIRRAFAAKVLPFLPFLCAFMPC
jgi:hypothetical protein